ncbi:MAG: hypothetical protein JNL10_17980 [Verrucomicrobiales bacterium]|nr:hypothetical protein [Verrucomicrobiales bacterium]
MNASRLIHPLVGILLCVPATAVFGAIEIPGISGTPVAGIDGAFELPASTVVDLGTAATGTWDSAPPAGFRGVYDPEKWAVVYKFSSVSIPTGWGITFRNHPSRAPVVWLVTGDVTINGNLILDGESPGSRQFAEPGPGGFRGGANISKPGGGGLGPGGGALGDYSLPVTLFPGGGGHREPGPSPGSVAYGDPGVQVLLGGSGGGARETGVGGGGGGGALLIIATGRITLNGTITARGGPGRYTGGGSGGAVRLVASEIFGNGQINVEGGTDLNSFNPNSAGRPGYVATEAISYGLDTISAIPGNIQASLLTGPVRVWPNTTTPTARIVTVANLAVPPDPRAALGVAPTDVNVPVGGSRKVRIETRNFPTTGTVRLYVTPTQGERTELLASVLPGGTESLAQWEATLESALTGRVALQVHGTAP